MITLMLAKSGINCVASIDGRDQTVSVTHGWFSLNDDERAM